jgi:Spy/CpxP family protein refolding chaperone
MRTIRILFLAIFAASAVITFGPNTYGQMGRPAAGPNLEGMHGGLQQMLQQLNLSPQQKQQIRHIMISERRQLQQPGLSPEQEKAIKAQGRQQIAAVLTPEQKQQLKKMMMEKAAANKQNAALQEEADSW